METLSLKYRDIFLYLYLNPAINEGFEKKHQHQHHHHHHKHENTGNESDK